MQHFSYRKLWRSFGYALQGLKNLVRTEQNALVHTVITTLLIFLVIVFHLGRLEIGLVFFAVGQVFAIEIVNTAIEKLLDIVHPETHSQIAFVKDALAGAVLIAACIALFVFVLVFYPHVLPLFR